MLTTHEVLVKARNRLARDGWLPRYSYEESGPNCAVGHLDSVMGGPGNSTGGSAYRALHSVVGNDNVAVGNWNDAPGRTKDEVLAAFDAAIALTAPAPDLRLTAPEPTTDCPATEHSSREPEPKAEADIPMSVAGP